MPSLMKARWVGKDSGPIFRRLLTKIHRIKFACVGVSVVCNAVFPVDDVLLRSGDIRRYSGDIRDQVVRNRAEILMCLGRKFRSLSKFLTECYKSGSPSNMWQSLVTIGQAASEIRRRKRSKLQR